MSTLSNNACFPVDFNIRLTILGIGVRIKSFLHLRLNHFHTGFIKGFNNNLILYLRLIQRRNRLLLTNQPITVKVYEKFRRDYILKFSHLYHKMEKSDFLDCADTKKIAEEILYELYETEGKLRMSAFSDDYKPNHKNDIELINLTSHISKQTAASSLADHEVFPG